jgi:hypothetical protein
MVYGSSWQINIIASATNYGGKRENIYYHSGHNHKTKQTNSVALSPQANYTD